MVAPPQTAKASGDVKISKVTSNSVTISWPAQANTAYETVTGYQAVVDGKVVWQGTATSCKLTGLSKGWAAFVTIKYTYTGPYGSGASSLGYTYANTTPATISTKNFGVGVAWTNKLDIEAKRPKNASNIQFELYSRTGKKLKSQIAYGRSSLWTVKQNTVYKYRVRAVYENSTNKKNYYGAWSGYRYFDFATLSGSSKSGRKGVKITLKRSTGVKSYTIAVSTKKNAGYKNVKTIKVTSKKTYTAQITKYGKASMKKGKTYYIRVTPNIKVGKTTKKSDITTKAYYFNYK